MKKKSERVEYKLKDGSVWSAIYNSYNVSRICRQDVEKLMEAQDKAYEQAQQLQTIIENLEEIKAKERCLAIDDFTKWLEENSYRYIESFWQGHSIGEALEDFKKEQKNDNRNIPSTAVFIKESHSNLC